jgi:hypothetical protein
MTKHWATEIIDLTLHAIATNDKLDMLTIGKE